MLDLIFYTEQAIIGICRKLEQLRYVSFAVESFMFPCGGKGMVEEDIVQQNVVINHDLVNLVGIKVKKCLLNIEKCLWDFYPKCHLKKETSPGTREKLSFKQETKRMDNGGEMMLDMMPFTIGLNFDWDYPNNVNFVRQLKAKYIIGLTKVGITKEIQPIG